MAIEKGRPWGAPAPEPQPEVVADSDAELAALAAAAVADGRTLTARVATGDLLATLGVTADRPPGERYAFPVDLGMAYLRSEPGVREDGPHPFVAHLIVGSETAVGGAALNAIVDKLGAVLGHGPAITVSVMNAAWHGDLRLGPRAHPNDGLLDITEGRVRFRERREAVKRARSGSHLPHPALTTTRTGTWSVEFDHPRAVALDGVPVGRRTGLRVELFTDAITVVA